MADTLLSRPLGSPLFNPISALVFCDALHQQLDQRFAAMGWIAVPDALRRIDEINVSVEAEVLK